MVRFSPYSYIKRIHGPLVHERRIGVLAERIAPWMRDAKTAADVGCGDTRLAQLISAQLPACRIEGYEILPRPGVSRAIPVHAFDGKKLPLADDSIDDVLLVDVIHHAEDPFALLQEAVRVARRQLIIKDHRLSKLGASWILTAMDWAGNRPSGVSIPCHYWSEEQWRAAWQRLALSVDAYETRLGLYPGIFAPFFEHGLHFLARLSKSRAP